MSSQLNIKKIAGLTSGVGSHTLTLETGGADRVTVTNTAVTISGNQTVSGILTATGNSVLTTTSSNFKMVDVTTNAFYRVGTWTPIVSSSGATDPDATVLTTANQIESGEYIRIGDLVFISYYIKLNAVTPGYTNGGASGDGIRIVGLPFTISNATTHHAPGSPVSYFTNWTGWPASYEPLGRGVANTKQIHIYFGALNGMQNITMASIVNADAEVAMSMTYRTDDA